MKQQQKHIFNKYNFIDLFAGAGGLSEGFIRHGFHPIAHVEMNKDASDTLKTRAAYHYLKKNNKLKTYYKHLENPRRKQSDLWNLVPQYIIDSVINKEISEHTLQDIFSNIDILAKGKEIDLIIGGPPCQAYSVAGRARDPNKMKNDPRNYIYRYYIQFLKRYCPKIFVFENVPGILSANNGEYLKKIFDAVKEAGYNVSIPEKKFLNAKNFNVLQDRKRVIIIGWKKDLNLQYPFFKEQAPKFKIYPDLFSDLKKLKNGEGNFNCTKYSAPITKYLKQSKIRNGIDFTTQHLSRPNNDIDLEIYKLAVEEWSNRKRLNYSKLPERLIKHSNRHSFMNRFQVVDGSGISHTLVAHIAMDGHYYIHPDKDQNRSITVREAARIQSFPDDYFFEGSRTAVFKQIGNAVPVLMAEGIAKKIKEMLCQI